MRGRLCRQEEQSGGFARVQTQLGQVEVRIKEGWRQNVGQDWLRMDG